MKAIIIDTETSGLLPSRLIPLKNQPSIIEFYGALVDLDSGVTETSFHTFIKPPAPVTEEITKITGITNQMLEASPRFPEVYEDLHAFLQDPLHDLNIAHNASFDREMLDIEFERCGMTVAWPRWICTVEQTICIRGYRLSLTNLHEELFGEAFLDAHRADIDTQALIRCCVELYRRGFI